MLGKIILNKKNDIKVLDFLAIASCFFVSFPTAWLSFGIIGIILAYLISLDYKKIIQIPKLWLNFSYKVPALSLLILYFIGIFYSSASLGDSLNFFLKYLKLILIPILIYRISSEKVINYCINAFLFGSIILVAISYGKYFNILPFDLGLNDISEVNQGFTAFKNRIAHNILISFASYIFLCRFRNSLGRGMQAYLWLLLAFIFLIDLFYLVNGRSGQIVAISLILLFIFKSFRRSSCFLALAFIALTFSIFPSFSSYIIPERLINLHNEIQLNNDYDGGRMKMYESSVVLIKNNPFFGTGTGSTYTEFKKMNFILLDDNGAEVKFLTKNPHNQYLLTLIELGFLGLFLLLNFFYSCYNQTKILRQNIMKDYSQGLLLLMIIGCLFNSMLVDATEGRFFCIMMGIILSANNIQKRKM